MKETRNSDDGNLFNISAVDLLLPVRRFHDKRVRNTTTNNFQHSFF